MIIYNCNNLSQSFGDREILRNINLIIYEKNRIGIIGDNGCGKTTLLKILTESEELEYTGDVFRAPNITLSVVAQNSGASLSEKTVLEEFTELFSDVILIENEIQNIEYRLSHETDTETSMALSDKLSRLYDEFSDKGGLTFRNRIDSTLRGLKFFETEKNLKVKELSGGQKTRLALGKALLMQPDVLALDEPTNHLDSDSIQWLEDNLKNYNGTLLIISHDRMFLDNTTTQTFIIENGEGKLYNAPYSKYKELRAADKEYQEKCYKQQQKEIQHIKDVIAQQKRWNQEHNYVTAEAWQKKLDKIDIIEKPDAEREKPRIEFNTIQRGGNEVLTVKDLSFSFPTKQILKNVNFELRRKDILFITGPNGCGKSTLFKIITGELEKDTGTIKLGANIDISYYSQNFTDLNFENTLFEEIFEAANYDYYNNQGGLSKFHGITDVRNSLALFGFKGEDVFKKIDDLSGGEKARVALLKITFKHANLLILDEPTNHLDISTCEVLEDALLDFEGTIMCVSHDRYFRQKLQTKELTLSLLNKEIDLKATEPSTKEAARNTYQKDKETKAKIRKLEREQSNLESEMEKTTIRISEIDNELSLPENAADYSKLKELFESKTVLQNNLNDMENRYFEVIEELESINLVE